MNGDSSESSDEPRDEKSLPYDTSSENYAGIASVDFDSVSDARDFAQMMVDTVHESLLVMDFDHCVVAANESFYQTFNVRPEETQGLLVYELGNGQWDIPKLHTLLEDVLPDNQVMEDYEVEHTFEDIGRRVMLLNARRLDNHQMILLSIENITERKAAEDALRETNAALEKRTRQVHQLSSMLTMVEQEERHRIAQILHDDLQQQFFGLRMKLEMARGMADPEDKLRQHLDAAEDIATHCIRITRDLIVDLSPPILKSEGLVDALNWLKVQMQDLHGLDVEVEAEQAFRTPEEGMRVLLFQIVRELLFNVVKHAGVDRAIVRLRGAHHHVEITVEDQGKGFDVAAEEARPIEKGFGLLSAREHFGLFSARERLGLFGGRMRIESAPGEGTRVTVDVPLRLE